MVGSRYKWCTAVTLGALTAVGLLGFWRSIQPVVAADPVEKKEPAKFREKLFEGWDKPLLALVVTGRQNGYFEPCGCTGLSTQKGGLARRHTFLQTLANQGWNVVPLDVGNQVRKYGRQSEIKFQRTVDAMKNEMGYAAATFGPDDLQLSSGEVYSAIVNAPDLFISANATVVDLETTPPFKVIEVAGKRIGVTAILGTDEGANIKDDLIKIQAPEKALRNVVTQLKSKKCDLLVLLAHASRDESRALAAKFPDFQVVVTAGGAEEPAYKPEVVKGTETMLVQVGAKGMYAGVIGVFDKGTRLRYQRVPLDDRYADSEKMLEMLAAYQDQLQGEGWQALGLKALPHESGKKFVGSEKCGECHSKAYDVWKKTPHSTATDTLVSPPERSGIPRHFDPECVSCHTTGWEPQKMFPFVSGFQGLTDTPQLVGNGCENCHGPGSAHVEAEEGSKQLTADQQKKLRQSMRLPLTKAEQKCMECHDVDNSPAFHAAGAFEKYWKKVEHKGKD